MEPPVEHIGGFDETVLVNRARGGDFRAFAELVTRHEASIFRLARHVTTDEGDAEELLQATFLEACQELDRLRDSSRFRPWLIRIALRQARNGGRDVALDEAPGLEREMGRPGVTVREVIFESAGPLDADRETLERALAGLRPILRVVFVLRDLEGIGAGDIAAMLDLPETVVRRLLMAARMQLRERLMPFFAENSPDRHARHTQFRPQGL